MLYIGGFFQFLSLKVSRDSFLKFEKGKASRTATALQATDGNNMDRRGLMGQGAGDADDEEVHVNL